MTTGGSITIREMIVHQLDPHTTVQLALSDLPVSMPVTPKVEAFLTDQIRDNQIHRRARCGKFLNRGSNPLMREADALLSQAGNPTAFVAHSQEIARQLFSAMQSHPKISPGDLVVCLFTDSAYGGDLALALLKLDRQSAFRGVARPVGGQMRVVLEEADDVLTRGDLHKCAFLLPVAARPAAGYDLIVLDQQSGHYNATRQVASFFLTLFLQSEVGLNRVEMTQAFVGGSREWLHDQEGWSDADRLRFEDRVFQVVTGEQVDVVAFADEALPDLARREAYVAYLQNRGVQELVFSPDPRERRRLADFVTYTGDNGLRVRVRREGYGAGRTVDPSQPDEDGYKIIKLRTRVWSDSQVRGRDTG